MYDVTDDCLMLLVLIQLDGWWASCQGINGPAAPLTTGWWFWHCQVVSPQEGGRQVVQTSEKRLSSVFFTAGHRLQDHLDLWLHLK